MMKKTTLYLPEDLLLEFERVAKREDKTRAEISRELIESYVREHQSPKPKAKGIYSDPEVNSTNYKDWLRENWRPE